MKTVVSQLREVDRVLARAAAAGQLSGNPYLRDIAAALGFKADRQQSLVELLDEVLEKAAADQDYEPVVKELIQAVVLADHRDRSAFHAELQTKLTAEHTRLLGEEYDPSRRARRRRFGALSLVATEIVVSS